MYGLYICVIILSVLLILFFLIKAKLEFKYIIMGIDNVISELKISILNIYVYDKKVNKKTTDVISSYLNNKLIKTNTKQKKIDIRLVELLKQLLKEKILLKVSLGIKDSIIPIYLIPTLSTIFSFYLLNNFKEKYIKNLHYRISPDYFHTYILIDAKITFTLFSLIKVLKLKNKYKEEKDGKSPN